MRSVFVPTNRAATLDEVRNGTVIILAAGVTLALPQPASDCAFKVKAIGAGSSIISPSGIETGDMTTSTAAIELAIGEALDLVSYRRRDDSTQSAYLLLSERAGLLASKGLHAPVRLMSAGALAAYTADSAGVITADANGALTVDSVAVANGDRIGLKDAAAALNNGIFVVTDLGSAGTPFILTPAEDFNSTADIVLGATIHAALGTANTKTRWMVTAAPAVYLTNDVTIAAGA